MPAAIGPARNGSALRRAASTPAASERGMTIWTAGARRHLIGGVITVGESSAGAKSEEVSKRGVMGGWDLLHY